MVFVGTPYRQRSQILTTEGIGGLTYGPAIMDELTTARNLGHRAAQVAEVLKGVRQER